MKNGAKYIYYKNIKRIAKVFLVFFSLILFIFVTFLYTKGRLLFMSVKFSSVKKQTSTGQFRYP